MGRASVRAIARPTGQRTAFPSAACRRVDRALPPFPASPARPGHALGHAALNRRRPPGTTAARVDGRSAAGVARGPPAGATARARRPPGPTPRIGSVSTPDDRPVRRAGSASRFTPQEMASSTRDVTQRLPDVLLVDFPSQRFESAADAVWHVGTVEHRLLKCCKNEPFVGFLELE